MSKLLVFTSDFKHPSDILKLICGSQNTNPFEEFKYICGYQIYKSKQYNMMYAVWNKLC